MGKFSRNFIPSSFEVVTNFYSTTATMKSMIILFISFTILSCSVFAEVSDYTDFIIDEKPEDEKKGDGPKIEELLSKDNLLKETLKQAMKEIDDDGDGFLSWEEMLL